MRLPGSLQALEPAWARLCLAVDSALEGMVPNLSCQSFVVGCSGGSDSVALLHILHLLAPRRGFSLHCAHLDHGLRPESQDDLRFVEDLCAGLGVPFHSGQCDIRSRAQDAGKGLEETGRIERYAFLEKIRQDTSSSHILLAHHRDDLAEDVLLRLVRGTNWPGLGGMPAMDMERALVRPLLSISKKTLISFLEAHGIHWREDESNQDMAYARNRIRHQVLPLLVKENPQFTDAMMRLHNQADMDATFFQELVERVPCEDRGRIIIVNANDIISLHASIRMRFYKSMLDRIGPGQVLGTTLADLDFAVMSIPLPHVKTFQFPRGKVARIHGNRLEFHLQNKP